MSDTTAQKRFKLKTVLDACRDAGAASDAAAFIADAQHAWDDLPEAARAEALTALRIDAAADHVEAFVKPPADGNAKHAWITLRWHARTPIADEPADDAGAMPDPADASDPATSLAADTTPTAGEPHDADETEAPGAHEPEPEAAHETEPLDTEPLDIEPLDSEPLAAADVPDDHPDTDGPGDEPLEAEVVDDDVIEADVVAEEPFETEAPDEPPLDATLAAEEPVEADVIEDDPFPAARTENDPLAAAPADPAEPAAPAGAAEATSEEAAPAGAPTEGDDPAVYEDAVTSWAWQQIREVEGNEATPPAPLAPVEATEPAPDAATAGPAPTAAQAAAAERSQAAADAGLPLAGPTTSNHAEAAAEAAAAASLTEKEAEEGDEPAEPGPTLKKRGFLSRLVKRGATSDDADADEENAAHEPVTVIPEIDNPAWEEIERYPVQEPYAFIRIIHDHHEHEYVYELIEPPLSERDRNILEFVEETLVDLIEIGLSEFKENEASELLRKKVDEVLHDYSIALAPVAKEKILYYILRDFLGFGLLDPIMRDEMIEDVSCDGPNVPVFLYHRKYESLKSTALYQDDLELDSYVIRMAQRSGKHVSIAEPLLDATLPDGSRLNATLSKEVTANGSTFTIRKFKEDPFTPPDLVRFGTMDADILAYWWMAVQNGASAIYAGGTASGKTTSLNAILLFIPPQMKIVSIEDTREVNLPHQNWIAGITRSGHGPRDTHGRQAGEIDMFTLLKAALRQRPEYILVGEVRGQEAIALFQAMATGHTAYGTMHADSVEAVIHRLESEPISIPRSLLEALDIVSVQIQTRIGEKRVRRTKEIVEIVGLDPHTREILTNEVFNWSPATDEYEFSGVSYVLERIQMERNKTETDMRRELDERKELIAYMIEGGFRELKQVSKVIIAYYKDPENTMNRVRGELEVLRAAKEAQRLAEEAGEAAAELGNEAIMRAAGVTFLGAAEMQEAIRDGPPAPLAVAPGEADADAEAEAAGAADSAPGDAPAPPTAPDAEAPAEAVGSDRAAPSEADTPEAADTWDAADTEPMPLETMADAPVDVDAPPTDAADAEPVDMAAVPLDAATDADAPDEPAALEPLDTDPVEMEALPLEAADEPPVEADPVDDDVIEAQPVDDDAIEAMEVIADDADEEPLTAERDADAQDAHAADQDADADGFQRAPGIAYPTEDEDNADDDERPRRRSAEVEEES